MDLGLQKYEAFLAVAESGSFTVAARKMGYSQSGISRMIASLEAALGLSLFERLHGKVRLTEQGSALLPAIRGICGDARILEEEAEGIKGLQSGVVRIGTFTSVATYWLPEVIAAFQSDYPGIECDLRLGDYSEIEQWLEEGSVDCGFLRMPTRPGFEARMLAEDEFMAVVPDGHELSDMAAIPVEKLADYPFMELANGGVSDVSFIFDDAGIQIRPRVSTWDDYAIMAMVESGLGVAVLPSLVLTRSPFRICALPLDPPAFRSIAIATRETGRLSMAASKFMEYLSAWRNQKRE